MWPDTTKIAPWKGLNSMHLTTNKTQTEWKRTVYDHNNCCDYFILSENNLLHVLYLF